MDNSTSIYVPAWRISRRIFALIRPKDLLRRLTWANESHRARLHLAFLPDYVLLDMGLRREDIARIKGWNPPHWWWS